MSAIQEIREAVRHLDVRSFDGEFLLKKIIGPVCLHTSERQLVELLSPSNEADQAVVVSRMEKVSSIAAFAGGASGFGLRALVCGGPSLRSRDKDLGLVVVAFLDQSYHFSNKLMSSGSGDRVPEHLRTAVSTMHTATNLLTASGVNCFVIDRALGPGSQLGRLALDQCGDNAVDRSRYPLAWCTTPDPALIRSAVQTISSDDS